MKKKFLSILAVAAMASCCAISASAAVYDQVTLVYDEADSTPTAKSIDVYCAGDVTYAATLDFLVEGVTILDYSFTPAPDMFDAPVDRLDWNDVPAGKIGWMINGKAGEPVSFNGAPIATLTLTIPEDAKDFTVELAGGSCVGDADWNEDIIEYDTKITIPGAAVEEPKTPYVPTNLTAQRFDKYENDVPVDAWSTTIDYSTTEVKGALKWAISNGIGTAKVDATVVTTEGSVVYGLFIAGQASELDTIESVKLVAETVVE